MCHYTWLPPGLSKSCITAISPRCPSDDHSHSLHCTHLLTHPDVLPRHQLTLVMNRNLLESAQHPMTRVSSHPPLLPFYHHSQTNQQQTPPFNTSGTPYLIHNSVRLTFKPLTWILRHLALGGYLTLGLTLLLLPMASPFSSPSPLSTSDRVALGFNPPQPPQS